MNENTIAPPSGVKLWLLAFRAYSFPASIIPAIFGAVLAVLFNPGLKFNYIAFSLTVVGSVLAQILSNVVNDIYDFKKGIDKEDKSIGIPHGGSMVISMGLVSSDQMKKAAIIVAILGVFIGIYLYTIAGTMVLFLTLFAILSALLYTASPAALKYKALGDIQVFVSFGMIITLGSYIIQAPLHEFSWMPVLLSIPLGLLIVAILHSNNIRDINFDGKFGVKTLPIIIGEPASRKVYYFLLLGAYAAVLVFALMKFLPYTSLLCFVTLPIALKLCKMVDHFPTSVQERYDYGAKHIMMTAQLNMQFGLTMIIGILAYVLFMR